MRGDSEMMLFHPLSKHTGLYQHGCTSDGLRGFPWTQRQRDRSRAHPARGSRSLGTIPATRSQPRPGRDPALPLKLWADGLQLWVSVPQMCTKHQAWQAPRPPDRVHEEGSRRALTLCLTDSSVYSRPRGDLKVDLEPVAFPSKHKVC